MQSETIQKDLQVTAHLDEARRQLDICNACRYCEGYCSVFPAVHSSRSFATGDLNQLANLCHNCRGCYYACQYTAPHEFQINLPKALAEVRQDSWEEFAFPQAAARMFQRSGVVLAIATVIGLALLIGALKWLGSAGGEGFYASLSHNMMVAIFAPAFLFPLFSLGVSVKRYWQATGGGSVRTKDIVDALQSVFQMKNLAGGHGDGCNFEDEDRFTRARQMAHQLIMYGFLLCFAATSVGTLMHYFFNMPAPYPLFSLPKLLGVPGGIMLTFGTVWMASLKLKADKELGDVSAWGGEIAFILLLGFVAFSGLLLYVLGTTALMPSMLAIHLGAVLAFFLLTPYSKMAHGFYRLASLVRDAKRKNDLQQQ